MPLAPVIGLALTASLTLWSVYSTLMRRASVPTRAEWDAAADIVRAHWRAGDHVTWYPMWADEARLSLHGLTPLVLPHPRGADREVDLGRARRVWVLGAFGYDGAKLISGADVKPLQPLRLAQSPHHVAVGDVSISLLEVGGAQVTADLLGDLDEPELVQVTRVRLSSHPSAHLSSHSSSNRGAARHAREERCDLWALDGWHCSPRSGSARRRAQRCLARSSDERLKRRSKRRDLYTLDRRRWLSYVDCGLNPTEHVSRDWRVIGEAPRRCVWLAPHRGYKTSIQWTPHASRSARRDALWVGWGWGDLAARHPFRSSAAQPLKVSVKRGAEIIWSRVIQPQLGWSRAQLSLTPTPLIGPPEPLTISVEPTAGVRDAALCVHLSVRSLP